LTAPASLRYDPPPPEHRPSSEILIPLHTLSTSGRGLVHAPHPPTSGSAATGTFWPLSHCFSKSGVDSREPRRPLLLYLIHCFPLRPFLSSTPSALLFGYTKRHHVLATLHKRLSFPHLKGFSLSTPNRPLPPSQTVDADPICTSARAQSPPRFPPKVGYNTFLYPACATFLAPL